MGRGVCSFFLIKKKHIYLCVCMCVCVCTRRAEDTLEFGLSGLVVKYFSSLSRPRLPLICYYSYCYLVGGGLEGGWLHVAQAGLRLVM